MFCQSCGSRIEAAGAAWCSGCGTRLEPAPAAASGSKTFADQAGTALRDAFDVLKRLTKNPVDAMGDAYSNLGEQRALGAGIVLGVAFAIAAAVSFSVGAVQIQRSFFGPGIGFAPSASNVVATAFRALMLPAGLAVALLAFRKWAGAQPPIAADVFSAGASVMPLGAALLLASLVGVNNYQIAMVLLFFALAFVVLMLYAGLTSIGAMPRRGAAPAVPASILAAVLLCGMIVEMTS